MSRGPSIGDVITLENSPLTRRSFLGSVGAGVSGLIALKQDIARAEGGDPEGVPLVLTRDGRKEPKKVRMVSEERHESLKTFRDMHKKKLFERYGFLNGITVTTPNDKPKEYNAREALAFKAYIDEGTSSRRERRLPNRIRGFPVYVERREEETTTEGCRENQIDDPAGGGSHVYTDSPVDGEASNGTLWIAGYDEHSGVRVGTMSGHVAQKAYAANDLRVWQGGQHVGRLSGLNMLVDAAKFEVDSWVTMEPRHIVESGLPDVDGSWDFDGLSDATSGWLSSGPDVSFAGAVNCNEETAVDGTEHHEDLYWRVTMEDDVTNDGDSGGPYVDDDGALVAIHTGTSSGWLSSNSYGSAGTETLNNINVRLE